MPIYDFKCLKCNTKFEELCRFEDTILCPTCKNPAERQISAPMFYFVDARGHSTTPVHIPDDIAHASEEELDRDLGLT